MHRIENFELSTLCVVTLQARAGTVIRVTAGRLWLTVQRQPLDVWLQAGESWSVPGANAVLWLSAEALACFQIAHAIAARRRPAAQLALAFDAVAGVVVQSCRGRSERWLTQRVLKTRRQGSNANIDLWHRFFKPISSLIRVTTCQFQKSTSLNVRNGLTCQERCQHHCSGKQL